MRPTLSRAAIAITLTWCATATADDRVELELSYAAEAFAARGLERCCAALGVATAGVDVDLEHVTAHLLGFAIYGDGLTAQLEDIHGVSNLYADDDVRLYEAWLAHARDAWARSCGSARARAVPSRCTRTPASGSRRRVAGPTISRVQPDLQLLWQPDGSSRSPASAGDQPMTLFRPSRLARYRLSSASLMNASTSMSSAPS